MQFTEHAGLGRGVDPVATDELKCLFLRYPGPGVDVQRRRGRNAVAPVVVWAYTPTQGGRIRMVSCRETEHRGAVPAQAKGRLGRELNAEWVGHSQRIFMMAPALAR